MLRKYYSIILIIKITLLVVQLTRAFKNSTAGACESLIPSASTTFTCKYNNKTLDNCINPIQGTVGIISCNEFYEEYTLENNQNRTCTKDGWDNLIPECYLICGEKRTKIISNSSNVQTALLDYPWQIGIYNSTKHFLCGGTIIEMNIVLTAAHCVAHYLDNTSLPTLLVASGKYYNGYDDKRDEFAQFSEVRSIEVPEEYRRNSTWFSFNIAILVLQNAFLPSPVVMPICIDFNKIPHNVVFEDNGIITGWNLSFQDHGEEISEALQEIKVLYIPNSNCSTKIQKKFVNYVIPDIVCAVILDNETTVCSGELVGSLIFKNRLNRYFIKGIVSWIPNTDESVIICDQNQISISTSISYHKNFIRNYTDSNQTMHSCHLPDFPPHGKYVFKNDSDTNTSRVFTMYKPGHTVPPYTELTLLCFVGFNISTPLSADFYCSNFGHWNPNPGGCIKQLKDEQTLLPSDKSSGFNYVYAIFITAILLLFVIALVAVIVLRLKFKKEKELNEELKLIGLDQFQYGDLKNYNPALGIGAQAELLPYNYNYEFPIDKLELGKQLGSGAFGIVRKAYAHGIISKEEKTKVAVKMVKDIVDNIQIKALISELKIMVHLGQHLNVVNLLGACTQNITKRKLFVIVEYCPFGNLCNYLHRNRPNFINQIDSVTGDIDYSAGLEDLDNISSVSSNASVRSSVPNTHYQRNRPEFRFNHTKQYKKDIKPLYTKDLISWSFQIACGMEYLSFRMVIHGDLAARNILLTENNIVKICDFGLSKKVYQNSNYKKHKDCLLPIKWMATESIRDLVFSTQSDVWSYGIVLWELFSLAQSPYPGMEADEKLYNKLLDGYRMDSPPYAPKEMYNIMCDCWNIDPLSRPSFNKLAGLVGLLLEENVRQHYIDLNDPYFVINTQRLNEGQKDYIGILNQANNNQQSLFASNYINRSIPKVKTSENSINMTPIYLPVENRDKI